MIATSGFLTALECTKFDFGRGSAPDPAGDLQRSHRPLAGLRGLLLRGGEGKGRETKGGRGRGRGGTGNRGMEGKEQDARESKGMGRGRDEEREEGREGREEK